jgi:drug/metabolite transporter (DMT)-like permease
MAIAMLCGSITTGTLGIVLEDSWVRQAPGWKTLGTLVWLSIIGSAAVLVGLEWLLRHYTLWLVSMGYTSVPGLAALMSMFFLGEQISWHTILGLLIILCALATTALVYRSIAIENKEI